MDQIRRSTSLSLAAFIALNFLGCHLIQSTCDELEGVWMVKSRSATEVAKSDIYLYFPGVGRAYYATGHSWESGNLTCVDNKARAAFRHKYSGDSSVFNIELDEKEINLIQLSNMEKYTAIKVETIGLGIPFSKLHGRWVDQYGNRSENIANLIIRPDYTFGSDTGNDDQLSNKPYILYDESRSILTLMNDEGVMGFMKINYFRDSTMQLQTFNNREPITFFRL